jgi:hypothetical protein
MFASVLQDRERVVHELADGRHAWIQIVRGAVSIDGVELSEGDGASWSEATTIEVQSIGDSELILFDVA